MWYLLAQMVALPGRGCVEGEGEARGGSPRVLVCLPTRACRAFRRQYGSATTSSTHATRLLLWRRQV